MGQESLRVCSTETSSSFNQGNPKVPPGLLRDKVSWPQGADTATASQQPLELPASHPSLTLERFKIFKCLHSARNSPPTHFFSNENHCLQLGEAESHSSNFKLNCELFQCTLKIWLQYHLQKVEMSTVEVNSSHNTEGHVVKELLYWEVKGFARISLGPNDSASPWLTWTTPDPSFCLSNCSGWKLMTADLLLRVSRICVRKMQSLITCLCTDRKCYAQTWC